ncbi:MAG: DNA-directed RNA polymerase subunit omega [Peptococcaceae bacterium]|nr:MAG: DNA-directed RNA polymerase subunit omega [Peptococcaceae bacterium]
MNQPTLDQLLHKVDSRYTLVVLAAKRARTITESLSAESDGAGVKPVTVALKEIVDDKVKYRRTRMGIK